VLAHQQPGHQGARTISTRIAGRWRVHASSTTPFRCRSASAPARPPSASSVRSLPRRQSGHDDRVQAGDEQHRAHHREPARRAPTRRGAARPGRRRRPRPRSRGVVPFAKSAPAVACCEDHSPRQFRQADPDVLGYVPPIPQHATESCRVRSGHQSDGAAQRFPRGQLGRLPDNQAIRLGAGPHPHSGLPLIWKTRTAIVDTSLQRFLWPLDHEP
jgi:hypothetical protein